MLNEVRVSPEVVYQRPSSLDPEFVTDIRRRFFALSLEEQLKALEDEFNTAS